jgi:hypothetical protein
MGYLGLYDKNSTLEESAKAHLSPEAQIAGPLAQLKGLRRKLDAASDVAVGSKTDIKQTATIGRP